MDICIGDMFYFNSPGIEKGHCLPDYMRVTEISKCGYFVTAVYEARAVETRPRLFSMKNLQYDSNLNPNRSNPSWIFKKALTDASMA